MLTQNFINKLLSDIVGSGGSSSSTNLIRGLLPVYSQTNGAVLGYFGPRYTDASSSLSGYNFVLNSSSAGIIVGSGTTAPSRSDYCLESKITSGLTASGTSRQQGVDGDGNIYVEFQLVLKNTSANQITISEIGYQCFTHCNYIYSAQNGTYSVYTGQVSGYYWLAERSLLSSPLTLEPGETGIIDYRITIDIS